MNLRNWWQARDARERRVLGIGGAVSVLLLGWGLVWQPLSASRANLRERVAAQSADLAVMRAGAARVGELRGQGARAKAERMGKSLLALADASARDRQLGNALKRVEPLGPKSVRVSLEGASFDSVAEWLDGLARDFGVTATEFSADRIEGIGLVNARVTLEEP
jgi:general secretion pathway protein M